MPRSDQPTRARHALFMVWFWYAQIPIAIALYFLVSAKIYFAYLVGISIETGIESAHARRNADLVE
jgi:hypothetical protein